MSAEGAGWSAHLQNAFAAIPNGASATVPVFIGRTPTATASGKLTITIASESDPSKRAIVTTALNKTGGL
jgi:hypothetical protein